MSGPEKPPRGHPLPTHLCSTQYLNGTETDDAALLARQRRSAESHAMQTMGLEQRQFFRLGAKEQSVWPFHQNQVPQSNVPSGHDPAAFIRVHLHVDGGRKGREFGVPLGQGRGLDFRMRGRTQFHPLVVMQIGPFLQFGADAGNVLRPRSTFQLRLNEVEVVFEVGQKLTPFFDNRIVLRLVAQEKFEEFVFLAAQFEGQPHVPQGQVQVALLQEVRPPAGQCVAQALARAEEAGLVVVVQHVLPFAVQEMLLPAIRKDPSESAILVYKEDSA